MGGKLPVGKLDMAMLEVLLGRYGTRDPRVLLGPKIGADAAVIQFGGKYLIAKTDPITFATDDIGWYLVHVNANDIACTGAIPRWLLVTILLPQDAVTERDVDGLFSQISEACQAINVSLVGGHTEVTKGLNRPIVVGHMLGEADKDSLVLGPGAMVGDKILLTKGIAIEGVALLAREKGKYLAEKGYAGEFIERCRDFIYRPGISIMDEALIAARTVKVSSMHDPTEGGLATGIAEVAEAAGVGVEVFPDRVKVYEECQVLCNEFGLDPMGVIASGSLLITVNPKDAAALLSEYAARRIDCACIGHVVEGEKGLTVVTPEGRKPLPVYPQDEVSRAL